MGIDVRLETETAEPIGEPIYDPSGHLASALAEVKGSLVDFIDPYGNTIFNQLQLPTVVREFETALKRISPPFREHVTAVVALLRTGLERPHIYARFIGD